MRDLPFIFAENSKSVKWEEEIACKSSIFIMKSTLIFTENAKVLTNIV